jgi:hypothetical protein
VYLAADGGVQPTWLVLAGIAGTILVAFLAARGPVWVEKVKARHSKQTTPAQKVAGAEEVLREWLKVTRHDLSKALKENDRLAHRIDQLEAELYRLGWDGRTA